MSEQVEGVHNHRQQGGWWPSKLGWKSHGRCTLRSIAFRQAETKPQTELVEMS